jgi:hypothetical protein
MTACQKIKYTNAYLADKPKNKNVGRVCTLHSCLRKHAVTKEGIKLSKGFQFKLSKKKIFRMNRALQYRLLVDLKN